jgi:hypothetical protein
MSSHREAPEISKDPVADSTDVYAFVSPDNPSTVTIIANYIPLQAPAGGPNFFEFGTDVLYEIHIDNDADAQPEITYQFRFQTTVRNPDTFLYNTGQILTLDDPHWNRPQFYSVTRVQNGRPTQLASGLTCPPCNIGPRSTPSYAALAQAAVHTLPSGEVVFAGQRREGFYVDLGSVFDLLALRPVQNLHLIPTPAAPSVNATAHVNVHCIAIQVPINKLTRDGSVPTNAADSRAVIGVWTSAGRQAVSVGGNLAVGPFIQVSRLGNPLVNEAVIAMGDKDLWNTRPPSGDRQFNHYVQFPEVAKLLPVLYPGVFPNLAALNSSTNNSRDDLVAILHTGIPAGIIPGFQNFTGKTIADMLRLNMAIPPAGSPNVLGILGGDLAGFPNGRRPKDDVVTVELRALAGATYPLVNPSYTPDTAASAIGSGLSPDPAAYTSTFPYLGTPLDGYSVPAS